MRLSAIVPATDRPPTLARTLRAIAAADEAPDEIIVVDRAPTPGPAAARNAGVQRAGGDVVVFVDADVEVRPDAFARIRAAFTADPALSAVFGSYDDAPDAPGLASGFRNLLHHHVHQRSPGAATTFWSGLGAVRRDALLAAGGFDADRYPHASIEDIELGARLVRDGARVVLDPRLQGKHLKAWSVGRMVHTDLVRRGAPWVDLQLGQRRASTALNLAWPERISTLLTAALVWMLARREMLDAGALLAALIVLDLEFYRLLLRCRGVPAAVLGLALHLLHRLVAIAAVALGVAMYARARLHLRRAPPPAVRAPVPPAAALEPAAAPDVLRC